MPSCCWASPRQVAFSVALVEKRWVVLVVFVLVVLVVLLSVLGPGLPAGFFSPTRETTPPLPHASAPGLAIRRRQLRAEGFGEALWALGRGPRSGDGSPGS